MIRQVDTTNSPHYLWGTVCDGWRLLDQPDLTVIEELMPPGTSETMHRHRAATQLFYVLDGQLSFRLAEGCVTVPTGKAVVIESGTPHQALNDSPSDVRFLVISAPSTTQDRETA